MILTRGHVHDIQQTLTQVVRASNYPISIIIVGVGKNNKAKFKNLEFLDGVEDEDGKSSLIDKDGNRAKRDIVQFVVFREFRHNYEEYTKELLAEIPVQIMMYMKAKGILPNNEIVKQKLREKAKGDLLKQQPVDVEQAEDYTDVFVKKLKE